MSNKTSKDNINNIPEDAGKPPVPGAIWVNEYVRQNGVRVHGYWRGPDGTHYEPYQFKFNDGSDTSIVTPRLSKKSQASPTVPAQSSVTVTTLSPKASASLTADSIADSVMSYINKESLMGNFDDGSLTDSFDAAEDIDGALLTNSVHNDIKYHAPQIVRDSILNGNGITRWTEYHSYEDMAEDAVRRRVYDKLGLDYVDWDNDDDPTIGDDDSSPIKPLVHDSDVAQNYGQVENISEYASEELEWARTEAKNGDPYDIQYANIDIEEGTITAIDRHLEESHVYKYDEDARRFVASAIEQDNEDAAFDDLVDYKTFNDAARHILRSQMIRKADLDPEDYPEDAD